MRYVAAGTTHLAYHIITLSYYNAINNEMTLFCVNVDKIKQWVHPY